MDNKKKFIKPEVEMIEFGDIDIITESDPRDIGDVDDTGID